jgi:alkanesulfonate monooxygenase SsuD/methylene tetrahydromethanopterin reductase-like flavin-dependent oxidoreductase (luciferase family)
MELTFGIKTSLMHVSYDAVRRVWQEADDIPEIRDAWLWDHLLPLAGAPDGPVLEGWTTLSALAAATSRLRLGHLVTSNRLRPPALLGKMSSTVDVISGGRLVLGLGVGGTMQPPGAGGVAGPNPALAEYAAYGIPLVSPREGIERLAETATLLKRMWTEDVFDFDGPFTTLAGNRNEPKPVQKGGPPLLIGGWGPRTLRVVAEHADVWNMPGPPHNTAADIAERGRVLDAHCAAVGRDPATIVRSTQMVLAGDDAATGRAAIRELVAAGVSHVVLASRRQYEAGGVRWLVEEVIRPMREEFGAVG